VIPFDFVRAGSLDEALEFLSSYGLETRIVAGGTDLLVELRSLSAKAKGPRYLLDAKPIELLRGIAEEGTMISIGSLTTHREVAESGLVKRYAPLLATACSTIGALQHRNVATIGGNIINASPAADSVPALIALDAEVVFRSRRGERRSPLKNIFVKPYKTNIEADEILTCIRFAKLPEGAGTSFQKLARRNALAIARMNIAVVVILEGRTVIDIRISPGSATPMPDRIEIAESVLLGREPTEDLIKLAGEKVSEEMIKRSGVRWSTPYKKPVIKALTARALREALRQGE
jgi:xanthine dehydrogenase FAD-binding subunit